MNQIAVGMALETSTAKMEVTQCQVRNKILRMRPIPNTGTASVSRSVFLTKIERSRSYGLTRKEIRTGKDSSLLNISLH